ncbi:MAG: hypothetical protein NTY53_17665 [Kiritimatiellaeota bacterium]|nr:hypothetical protein [Kiritimatiellota bacterium]
MDLSLEAIKLPAWDPASASEWDEAFEKVENYLRACRVASRLHRARLTALILQRAIERRAKREQRSEVSGQLSAVSQQLSASENHKSEIINHKSAAASSPPLSALAIEEARELVAHWLANLLPSRSEEQPFTLAEGFLALYLCDAPMRWPGAFLNPQQAPPDFADTLRSRIVKTGPELEVSSMVPRQIDLGLLPDLAESAFDTLDRFPLIKTLLVWTLFIAGLIFLFWYTRQ